MGTIGVEVGGHSSWIRSRSLQKDFIKPQMVAYLRMNRIVVSSEGDGSCKVFDADTYKLIDTVKYSDDADQLRYDSVAEARVMSLMATKPRARSACLTQTTDKKVGEVLSSRPSGNHSS